MKNTKYIKLGTLIICCITILVWGINYLKGIDIFKSSTTYYAKYEKVDGLVKSSTILINGFQVGLVQDVSFSDANDGSFIIELSIEGDFKIPKGSTAILASSDLLGTKVIKLQINPNQEYYAENDTLLSAIDGDMLELLGNEVIPIKNKAERLITSLDSTLFAVNRILDSNTQENLKQSIANFNATMQNMEEITSNLNLLLKNKNSNLTHIINNVDTITSSLASSSSNINNMVLNLANLSDSLASSNIKTTVDDLSAILAKINNGEGSLGALINNDELYNNIDALSSAMNNVVVDFQNNPSKYLKLTAVDFGRDTYISTNNLKSNDKYTFRIHLLDSTNRIELTNPMFKNMTVVEFENQEGTYSYLTSEFNDIISLNNKLSEVNKAFPNAQVIAYKDGKMVKLNKAIKELSK